MNAKASDSTFRKHYQSPDDVLAGMSYNASQKKVEYEKHLDTLNASDAMIAAGFSKEYVQYTKNRLIDDILPFESTGTSARVLRKKTDAQVQAVASLSRNF